MSHSDEQITIDREIGNWQKFGYALRKENRELFEKMISEARAFDVAFEMASSKEPAEALLMTLILQQQKIITKMLDALAKLEKTEK